MYCNLNRSETYVKSSSSEWEELKRRDLTNYPSLPQFLYLHNGIIIFLFHRVVVRID